MIRVKDFIQSPRDVRFTLEATNKKGKLQLAQIPKKGVIVLTGRNLLNGEVTSVHFQATVED